MAKLRFPASEEKCRNHCETSEKSTSGLGVSAHSRNEASNRLASPVGYEPNRGLLYPFSLSERMRELQRNDRGCSAGKQTPKIRAHGRRKEEAKRKTENQRAFGTRKRSSGLG